MGRCHALIVAFDADDRARHVEKPPASLIAPGSSQQRAQLRRDCQQSESSCSSSFCRNIQYKSVFMRAVTAIRMLIVTEVHLGALACTMQHHTHGRSSLQIVPAKTSMADGSSSTLVSQLAPSSIPEDYIEIIRNWRTKMGLKALIHDPKLENNALDTVIASNGKMTHKLNDGTFAQVLAQDKPRRFEDVLVGGWLCEMPGLTGLDGICAAKSEGWDYNGETGHAKILTSDVYSKIGCAWHADVRCCDLA
ncbi:hypothetical protein BKA63DRAFT_497662 [Paraphoma chrysanthemicola]|nr:hypothetical protein BKA63DRAFT_497662 [Paraphoma chrysanthemicola]